MVGEQTFYETAGARDSRYQALVRQVCVADPVWTAGFLAWLRGEANMRSAALVGAAEFVHARLTDEGTDSLTYSLASNRRVIDSVLQRADEPGELLAYWTSRYGRAIPKPVKRGIADAVQRLYTQRALLKYDTASHGFRFADVLDLVHPSTRPASATRWPPPSRRSWPTQHRWPGRGSCRCASCPPTGQRRRCAGRTHWSRPWATA
jgi:hypothetical protein